MLPTTKYVDTMLFARLLLKYCINFTDTWYTESYHEVYVNWNYLVYSWSYVPLLFTLLQKRSIDFDHTQNPYLESM